MDEEKRRRRAPRHSACARCKAGHRVCDGGRPCKRCKLRGKADQCESPPKKQIHRRRKSSIKQLQLQQPQQPLPIQQSTFIIVQQPPSVKGPSSIFQHEPLSLPKAVSTHQQPHDHTQLLSILQEVKAITNQTRDLFQQLNTLRATNGNYTSMTGFPLFVLFSLPKGLWLTT